MVEAQEWVDREYPKGERNEVKELHINKSLSGKLDPSDFTYEYGLKILLYPHLDHTQLQIINQPKNTEIFQLVEVQEYLDQNYPKEKRKDIKKLDISGYDFSKEIKKVKLTGPSLNLTDLINLLSEGKFNKANWEKLTGPSDVSDFINLEMLDCSFNKLTNLSISNCPKLEELRCSSNQLTNLNFLNSLTKKSLISLDISNNNLTGDLSLFSSFTKLEYLNLGDNSFTGDLSSLQQLTKLRALFLVNNKITGSCQSLQASRELAQLLITNTQINDGIEYLPRTVEWITDWNDKGISLKELIPYRQENLNDDFPIYSIKLWRQNQPGFKWLQNTLLKINPNLDINEIINNFEFFNAKTGEFQGDLNNLLFFFQINQEETLFLKKTIETLTNELKKHKEKIVNAYLTFCSEKELLKELINAELEYQKAKEQKQPSIKLKRQKEKLFDELIEKIGEEIMEEVETILTDCGNLVRTELELENKINTNKLIEDFKKEFQNLTINIIDSTIMANNGPLMIGNTQIGNNADFSYNNRLIELTNQELITQIEIPPKT